MIILGLDPGIATTGYGVIQINPDKTYSSLDYGIFTTSAKDNLSQRLSLIYSLTTTLIQNWNPAEVAIEKIFFSTNTKTAISVSHGRGVLLLAVHHQNKPLGEYTPLQVKQSVTGFGKADKEQIQQMVKILLNLKTIPKPDDAADALAVAMCHANHYRMARQLEGGR